MPTVTANAAAAVISYESGWGVGNGSERVTSEEWAVASLNFSGTSFYLYGRPSTPSDGGFYGFNLQLDQDGSIWYPYNSSISEDQPLYYKTSLDANQTHNVRLQFGAQPGMFILSHVNWTSSAEHGFEEEISVNSADSRISLAPSATWYPQNSSDPTGALCAKEIRANTTFSFQGSGIAIRGSGTPDNSGTEFEVYVNNMPMNKRFFAWAPEAATIDLYYSDTLGYGNHSVSLVKTDERQFCVSQARIFNAPSPTSTSNPPFEPASTTGSTMATASTSSSLPSGPSPLRGGQVAGIVISVLLISALSIVGGVMFYRRQRSHQPYVAAKTVLYERLCSSCGKPITDDYRLECVDPDCPAAVDLHVQCADWNIPERHSHPMHQVLNK